MSDEIRPLSRDDLIDRAKAKMEQMRRAALPHLGTYSQHYFPTMVVAEGLAPLYEVFDRIYAGEQVYALVEGPPRHGKSTNIFTGFARHLSKYPHHLIGYGAYNQTFANAQSRLARSIAEKCGVWSSEVIGASSSRFDPAQSVAHWQTAAGGGAKFLGRGGSALGSGFNLACIDDPIKNPDEAESETILNKAWEWTLGSVFNRLEPNASFMCTHQRWNDEDPIGRFKKQIEQGHPDAPPELRDRMDAVPWTVVTLTAVIGEGAAARPLMPTRFDMLALTRIRLTIGEFYWWAQYMQDPRPRGGRLFPEQFTAWLPWIDESGEARGIMVDGEFVPVPRTLETKSCTLVFGVDTATSDSLNADSTAIVLGVAYYDFDPQTLRDEIVIDVLRAWDEKLKSPDVVSYVARKTGALPAATVAYETQSVGKVQMQFFEIAHPEIVVQSVTTSSNKRIRATPAANIAGRGRLRLPAHNAPWVAPYKAQLVRFTGAEGKRDDKVDATAHMTNSAMQLPRSRPALEGETRGEFSRSPNEIGDDNGSLFGPGDD